VPRTNKQPFRADIRAKLIEIASKGQTINYLDIGAGRAMIGRYLLRIAREEGKARRPPLTSVVVRKNTGKPGDGFLDAMRHPDVMYARPGETEQQVWERGLSETHAYWRPVLRDEMS
jgi:hypothetical protein